MILYIKLKYYYLIKFKFVKYLIILTFLIMKLLTKLLKRKLTFYVL
jgi:hypothetical protein